MTQTIGTHKRAQPYNREAALNAAQALFWRKGYHATSLKDLEAALDMKPGSIYAAFKNKENLYLLSLERYFTQGSAKIECSVTSASSPLQGLADHLRTYGQGAAGSAQNNACMLVKTLLEATEDDAALSARARGYLDKINTIFVTAFEAAKLRGELANNTDCSFLALKYQAYISALRIESHRGSSKTALTALGEAFARDVESLRQIS
jgi:AcrR family transcriptional regulator